MTPPFPSEQAMLVRVAALMVLIVLAITTVTAAGAGFSQHPTGGAVTHPGGHDRDEHRSCPTPCPNPDCHRCHCTTTILTGTALAMSPPAVHSADGGDGGGYLPDPPPRAIFHPPRPALAASYAEREQDISPVNTVAGLPREYRP